MVLDDPRLSKRARRAVERAELLSYSIASFWEIALKLSKPGFDFPLPDQWDQELARELAAIGARRLQIEPQHCRRLQDLDWHHKDPFDRLLISQALVENLIVVTSDSRFSDYRIQVVW